MRAYLAVPSPTNDGVVLLIEDDADIRTAITECLEGEGFTVVSAGGVDQGLELLRRGIPDPIILLDLMMPGRTGWDFRQEQLADPRLRDMPVVVITACGVKEEVLRQGMGDVELVSKPFTTDVLLQAMARARLD